MNIAYEKCSLGWELAFNFHTQDGKIMSSPSLLASRQKNLSNNDIHQMKPAEIFVTLVGIWMQRLLLIAREVEEYPTGSCNIIKRSVGHLFCFLYDTREFLGKFYPWNISRYMKLLFSGFMLACHFIFMCSGSIACHNFSLVTNILDRR